MSLLDLKSRLDNRNSFEGSPAMSAVRNENNSSIVGPTVDKAFDVDGGVGDTIEERFFHGKANPGRLDGKKLGDVDLHVHLLEDTYNYDRAGFTGEVGPSPGPTGYSFPPGGQDLDLPVVDGVQGEPTRYIDTMVGLLP